MRKVGRKSATIGSSRKGMARKKLASAQSVQKTGKEGPKIFSGTE